MGELDARCLLVISAPRARELFFTARNISAAEALGWGLVGAVLPAAEVAARGADGALDPAGEEELVALREACFGSADFREGVRAFAEKRAPRWQGR